LEAAPNNRVNAGKVRQNRANRGSHNRRRFWPIDIHREPLKRGCGEPFHTNPLEKALPETTFAATFTPLTCSTLMVFGSPIGNLTSICGAASWKIIATSSNAQISFQSFRFIQSTGRAHQHFDFDDIWTPPTHEMPEACTKSRPLCYCLLLLFLI
jgi:hypothetical protein